MIKFDPSRLHQDLLNTGLQNKDNGLYQLLKRIIDALKQATVGVNENNISIQNNSSTSTSSSSNAALPYGMGESLVIEENYYLSSGSSSSIASVTTYDATLSNGDVINPEVVFDDLTGDVITVTGIPF